MVLLALSESLSSQLEQAADGAVRYLERYLPLSHPRQRPSSEGPQSRDEHAEIMLRVVAWLRRQGWKWAEAEQLQAAVVSDPAGRRQFERAIKAKLLTSQTRVVNGIGGESREVKTLMPDYTHPLVETISYLVKWLPERLSYSLQVKAMPYVDSNYLARGMTMDTTLRKLGVGQSRQEAEGWLVLATRAGLVERRSQPHPQNPTREVITWWLPSKPTETTQATVVHSPDQSIPGEPATLEHVIGAETTQVIPRVEPKPTSIQPPHLRPRPAQPWPSLAA